MIDRGMVASVVLITVLAVGRAPAESPYVKPDRSWINLIGTVKSKTGDRFVIRYGNGEITVEMDDWDLFNEADPIGIGERVAVYGKIDGDFLQKRTIEASSVYVFSRNSYYYASEADEEGGRYSYWIGSVPEGTWLSVVGTVESIEDREFQLDTGTSEIRIDTDAMSYDPLDAGGIQGVRVGDRVSVSGRVALDFFENAEVKARSIVVLRRAKRTVDRTRHDEKFRKAGVTQ